MLGLLLALVHSETLLVPGFTAYSLPDPDAVRMVEPDGATGWTDPNTQLVWYGHFAEPGQLEAAIRVQSGTYTLTVPGNKSKTAEAVAGTAEFGEVQVPAGYVAFTLTSDAPCSTVAGLELRGPAIAGAHFNLAERRNAASVHLAYPVPEGVPVRAFACEITADEAPIHTYYMATGWHRGYFGMQVNSATERRIIFSVWDSGNEAVDRDKVRAEDRVTLVEKGDGVFTGDFGNEGTGGHSHLKVNWQTGVRQRFVVVARPDGPDHAIFSGYWFDPERAEWRLISAWRAPGENGELRGLYSFSENFWGSTGHLVRRARFGGQWVLGTDDVWRELTEARFSHDPTGDSIRLDRWMGLDRGGFFLQHGGFVEGFTPARESFHRPALGNPPGELVTLLADLDTRQP